MKLQKRFLRKYNGKDYHKFMINIPPEIIEQSGFKEGEELLAEAKRGEIRLKRK
jgi:hypothetical protein